MSECCRDIENENLSECEKSAAFFGKINEQRTENANEECFDNNYDVRVFNASPNDAKDAASVVNCQTAESEVKLFKEWLMIQTDLIQQQNDDIIDKDREIFILRRENEMLRERINAIEKEICVQIDKESEPQGVAVECPNLSPVSPREMTQGFDDDFHKENVEVSNRDSENGKKIVNNYQIAEECGKDDSESESQINSVKDDNNCESVAVKSVESHNNFEKHCKKEESSDKLSSDYNYLVNICDSTSDNKNNLRMSITRKRVSSNSSALSPNESVTAEDKEPHRRFKKKKRRPTKDGQILTSTEPYVTQAHEVNLGIESREPAVLNSTLEVPRWRHKIYPSCYTMEGTENLDDEVYNKRHLRLEINERRRKRWDVQRIREQRVIEKLKQRQERVGSGSKGEEAEPLSSLWPKIEDIKYLEINEELPVSAFGSGIPKISSSEFSLPWMGNSSVIITKKSQARRSTIRKRRY